MVKEHETVKSVYIFCYAEYVSGGPEALHQLRYYMEKQGIDAWIVYTDKKTDGVCITPRYVHYFPKQKKYIGELDYKESSNHLIIMPENMSFRLFKYKKAKQAIWWLGVGAYDGAKVYMDDYPYHNRMGKIISWIRYRTENIRRTYLGKRLYIRHQIVNYCGSAYAYDYVTRVKGQNAKMLVEPISKEFLDAGGAFSVDKIPQNTSDEILYNPAKLSSIMKELLKRGNFSYKALKGYTPYQLIELYRGHKIYIDFGTFPGPERIPKEAVYNGCNILVGKQNAAENDFDVAIPDRYKLKNPSVEEVEDMIRTMIIGYESDFSDFDRFRRKIGGLEENFEKSINEYFRDYI